MIKILNLLMVLTLTVSCIKTAEQVQREKRFDNMSEQMTDSQSLIASMVAQMKDMQAQLDKQNGKVEEMEHRQRQIDPSALRSIGEELTLLKGQRETDSAHLLQIQNELKEQRGFLEKVTASLKSMGQSKKRSAKEELNEGLALVKQNKYSKARSELISLLDNKELSAGELNMALHGLGRVEYFTKNYDKALVYFSKIYTKYPKASLAPSSLLFIGKSLKQMGKKDEAKEAFAKLAEDYPGAREVQEAKKEL